MPRDGERSQPHRIVREAFTKFEALVGANDARLFRATTLADVREAARIIERDQSQRRCMRNMRRIEPLFDALHLLGGAIETLCQGTPYLCFIWKAPIKLLLQIADEYTNAFDGLLDAYRQIGQNLPRLGRFAAAFNDQDDFQAVLADIYSDILEFHSHAYKYLRRGGWKCLFDASWCGFSRRFNAILQRLARGRDLIDKEAHSFAILEAKAFRQQVLEDIERSEQERQDWQLRDTLAWLDLKGQDREQDDLFECRSRARNPDTCAWILENSAIRSWLDPEDGRPQLWLRGKPGSGKTTLATFLYENAPIPPNAIMLYCLCSYGFARSEASVCGLVFRSLIAQLIRKDHSLLPHVYDNFAKTGIVPSATRSRDLLKELLWASGPSFLVIDGLDECDGSHQRQLLSDLRTFLLPNKNSDESLPVVKILVCSRETKEIVSSLKKAPQVFLTKEKVRMSRDITVFAKESLLPLRSRFRGSVVDEIEQLVVEKADGMFLWVQLVLDMLLEQQSVEDLRQTLHELPSELPGVYASILRRLQGACKGQQKVQLQHILGWLTFSYRPLKVHELCDLVVFRNHHSLNDSTKLQKGVLDICKPLLEEHEDRTVRLVHFSAREYLLHKHSGPYLDRQECHLSITQSCIRYLITCEPFTVEPLAPRTCADIVKGFHDIFPYVDQFWPMHLTESFRVIPGPVSEELVYAKKDIRNLLLTLLNTFQTTMSYRGKEEYREAGVYEWVAMHSQDLTLEDLPELIIRHIDIKKRTRARPADPNSGTVCVKLAAPPDISKDPISLSLAFNRFQEEFERLLAHGSSGLDDEISVSFAEILEFRTRHSSGAYLCRWRGCVWASTGFSSVAERSTHEASHEERFRCHEPACDFAGRGFNSKATLRKHVEKYHTSLDDIVLPQFPSDGPSAKPTSYSGRPHADRLTSSQGLGWQTRAPSPAWFDDVELWPPPGGGGSMLPVPSPNSPALFDSLQRVPNPSFSPRNVTFPPNHRRTAIDAIASYQNNPFREMSDPQDTATSNMDSVHDASDAANGLFMLAKGGQTKASLSPSNSSQISPPSSPASIMADTGSPPQAPTSLYSQRYTSYVPQDHGLTFFPREK
ncbi:NACHT domain-containing protein [Cladophialophora immunda]|nr:NACHT domain-containing protein [Cladophialophora immunda]